VCTGIIREDDLVSHSASLARRGTRGNFDWSVTCRGDTHFHVTPGQLPSKLWKTKP
jgi:hypothetical protein